MGVVAKLGVAVTIGYLALLGHEVATGALFVREVAVTLVVHGMAPFPAHNFAAAIVLIAPLIACTGLLALGKRG